MHHTLHGSCLGLTLIALLAPAARGADPVETLIPADAQVYVTVNTRQFIDSDLFQRFYQQKMDDQKRAQLQVLNQLVGTDVLKNIDRVHAWGQVNREETMVAAIDGRLDQEKLSTLVKANSAYERIEEGGAVVHKWVDDKNGEARFGTFVSGDRLLIGNSLDALKKTLAARSDRSASIAASGGAEKFKAPADSTFYCFMVAPDTMSAPTELEALRDLTNATVSGKFTSSGLSSSALLEMKSAQAAKDMNDVVTGLLALARMQKDNPELRDLVSGISVNPAPSPSSVSIGLTVDQGKLFKLMDEAEVN